jgi:FHS family L-fucose permease-like MFS transporter
MDSHRNTELNVTIPVGKDVELEEGGQKKPTAATTETVEDETRPNA